MNDATAATVIQSSEGSVSGDMQYLEPPPPYESIAGTDQDNSNVPTGGQRDGPQTINLSHYNEPVYNETPPPYSMESNMVSEPVVWDDERNLVPDSSSQPIRCTKKTKLGFSLACTAAIVIVFLIIYLTKGQDRVNSSTCTYPYTPGNAKRIDGYSKYHYHNGISVQYQCMEGYKMIGHSTRTCLYTGAWDHPAPNCTVSFCDDPEQISNGYQDTYSKIDGGFRYGDDVHYSCYRGYKISGTRRRTCSPSGQWSGSLPVCTVVSCGRPAAPDNGRVFTYGTVFTYGQSVSYSCNPGYQLFGIKHRTCLASGKWNGITPVCIMRT